jgi:glutamine amidotransferase
MSDSNRPLVAIVDYELGNLFSVMHACEQAGVRPLITSNGREIRAADAVILPGVGAFGDAMAALRRRDLVATLHEVAAAGKPVVGICLGMQLLMKESYEFGRHAGLGILPGVVVRLENPVGPHGPLKVPQVCWNRLWRPRAMGNPWHNTLLDGLADGVYFYFVHSYYIRPENPEVVLATTRYGNIEFASCVQFRNIFACQGHPERSGHQGLAVYRNLTTVIGRSH